MTRQGLVASHAAIDACCLIDLLASGKAEAILRASGFAWRLPSAVWSEVRYRRLPDPAHAGKVVTVPADLTLLIASGLLTVCDPENQQELDHYTHYATVFRSDGESMCLALAEGRGWIVATDDRKAIRIAKQSGLTVVSCPELVKAWADASTPDQAALLEVLRDIQVLAQFKPNPSMPEYQWWRDRLIQIGP
jgi:hypothetical protein